MIFKEKDETIYCKDDYYSEFDHDDFDRNGFNIVDGIAYYNGYLVHRAGGPARCWCDGNEEWIFDGKLHREDGPATIYDNKEKYWYLNGKEYSEEEYLKIINLKNKNRVLNEI